MNAPPASDRIFQGAGSGSAPACPIRLSVVIPCYNERATLAQCVEQVLAIADARIALEIIIVDDGSTDDSALLADKLVNRHDGIVRLFRHQHNQGKGAALQTGFAQATGDYVAVQDADLEYDPRDLRRLLIPLLEGRADMVVGSRFLSYDAHRVLYYWHFVGNRLLTLLSNMFTNLNLTDMESCYKIFRRDMLRHVTIQEKRFGFEPEIVAKMVQLGARVYEMGISYHGRTYSEGKKIGAADGLRALYCIIRYNAYRLSMPIQFILYLFIGGTAALINLAIFLFLTTAGFSVCFAAPTAFVMAAAANYFLCILLLFRHNVRWTTAKEIVLYSLLVSAIAGVDLAVTQLFLLKGASAAAAKLAATAVCLVFNYLGRRLFIFPETTGADRSPSEK